MADAAARLRKSSWRIAILAQIDEANRDGGPEMYDLESTDPYRSRAESSGIVPFAYFAVHPRSGGDGNLQHAVPLMGEKIVGLSSSFTRRRRLPRQECRPPLLAVSEKTPDKDSLPACHVAGRCGERDDRVLLDEIRCHGGGFHSAVFEAIAYFNHGLASA